MKNATATYRETVEMKKVEAWNTKAKIGDKVEYKSHPNAKPIVTTTTTPASVLGGHTAVVWLEGISGCVATDACRLI